MNMLNPFRARAALFGCLLALCCAGAGADEITDISDLLKSGQTDKAMELVNTYLASKPNDAQARFQKGLILTAQGKIDDAIGVFTALTEDYPELAEPYNNLAALYAGQGQYYKARDALETAVRNHPSYATAYENLGDLYAKMAGQAYARAAQLAPDNAGVKAKSARIGQPLPAPAAK
jgi:tetratricopeptide (TPR) repeat protein